MRTLKAVCRYVDSVGAGEVEIVTTNVGIPESI
jgi:hypothetical protein